MMRLIVVGGGCYGCYHARQLLKAHHRGRLAVEQLLIVDRNPTCRARSAFAHEPLVRIVGADWSAFLQDDLDGQATTTTDQLVPAPFTPHLLFEWLVAALTREVTRWDIRRAPCALTLGLPYEHSDAVGNRFISAADWRCPATCIEPARCPAIGAQRTWELGDIVRAGAQQWQTPYDYVSLFTCRHLAFGVSAIPVAALIAARAALAGELGRHVGEQPLRALIGTVSACHGVLGELVAHALSTKSATTGRWSDARETGRSGVSSGTSQPVRQLDSAGDAKM
jgi:hypothetical protein